MKCLCDCLFFNFQCYRTFGQRERIPPFRAAPEVSLMQFWFQAGGLARLRGWSFKALWSLNMEVASLQLCLSLHSWETRTRLTGVFQRGISIMDARTYCLNLTSTFLAASMKFHQSDIIFKYSSYTSWPWKLEMRYIEYFAYRGAVHFQEVSSRMSRRGESETGN